MTPSGRCISLARPILFCFFLIAQTSRGEDASPSPDLPGFPRFTSPPYYLPAPLYEGERVIFQPGGFDANPPVSFQWYFNGTPIPDATDGLYGIPFVQPSHFGRYSVSISNSLGEARSEEVAFTNFLQNVKLEVFNAPRSFSPIALSKADDKSFIVAGSGLSSSIVTKFSSDRTILWSTNLAPRSILADPDSRPLLAVDPLGSSYLAVQTVVSGTNSPGILKLSSDGEILWHMQTGADLTTVRALSATGQRLIVAGIKTGFKLLSVTPEGRREWITPITNQVAFGGSHIWMGQASASNIYCGSESARTIIKFDAAGKIIWSTVLTNVTFGNMKVGPDGSVFAATYVFEGDRVVCRKYSPEGNREWSALFPARGGSFIPIDLNVDDSGNAYIFAVLNNSQKIARFNPNGSLDWVATVLGSAGYLICAPSADNVYLLGQDGLQRAIAKYDRYGVRRWQRTFGAPLDSPLLLALNKDEVIVGGTPPAGALPLVHIRDMESEQLKSVNPHLALLEQDTNLFVHATISGRPLGALTWYHEGRTRAEKGDLYPVSLSLVPTSTALQIRFPDGVLVTPDFVFDRFARFGPVKRNSGGFFEATIQSAAQVPYRILKSRDLILWEDAATMALPINGTNQFSLPYSRAEPQVFYRAIWR